MTVMGEEKPKSQRQVRMRREHLSNYAKRIFVQSRDEASPSCLRMRASAGEPVAPADAAEVRSAPLFVSSACRVLPV